MLHSYSGFVLNSYQSTSQCCLFHPFTLVLYRGWSCYEMPSWLREGHNLLSQAALGPVEAVYWTTTPCRKTAANATGWLMGIKTHMSSKRKFSGLLLWKRYRCVLSKEWNKYTKECRGWMNQNAVFGLVKYPGSIVGAGHWTLVLWECKTIFSHHEATTIGALV